MNVHEYTNAPNDNAQQLTWYYHDHLPLMSEMRHGFKFQSLLKFFIYYHERTFFTQGKILKEFAYALEKRFIYCTAHTFNVCKEAN